MKNDNRYYSTLFRVFVFMNIMDAFYDNDYVYLENIERDGYSELSDIDKRHIIKQLKNGMDSWKLDPIGMTMLLDFIKRHDVNDTEDIEL